MEQGFLHAETISNIVRARTKINSSDLSKNEGQNQNFWILVQLSKGY